MADTKISALTAASVAAMTNELAINEAGTSKKITAMQLHTMLMAAGMPRVTRSAGHSNSTTTPTKVTDLDMTLEVGSYTFNYCLIVRAATAGVMPQFNFNFTGTAAPVNWWFQYADLSATLLAAIGTAASNVTTPTLGFQMAQAENTKATTGAANMGTTGGLQATATDTMIQITGLIVVSATGDVELWHASETATATTVEAGSSLVVIRTA